MRKVVASEFISLVGVVQARCQPNRGRAAAPPVATCRNPASNSQLLRSRTMTTKPTKEQHHDHHHLNHHRLQ
jgi:hypothetical protein